MMNSSAAAAAAGAMGGMGMVNGSRENKRNAQGQNTGASMTQEQFDQLPENCSNNRYLDI